MDASTADLLTRTNAGTVMGNLMRRYWIPILGSAEIAQFCTHRGVSLFFGRNEECGIRCAYHGLKFNRSGECVDVPTAPQVAKRLAERHGAPRARCHLPDGARRWRVAAAWRRPQAMGEG